MTQGTSREAAGVVAVTSFSGSPGVTTTALALVAAWPTTRRVVLVEADPRGSALAIRFGLHEIRSVSTLLVDERHGVSAEAIARHVQLLPGPLLGREAECLVGGRPYQRGPDVRRLWHGFCDAAQGAADYIVDLGRFDPDAPTQPLLERAEQVFVLVGADLESIGVARRSFPRFAATRGAGLRPGEPPRRVRFICTGGGPYTAADLARVLEPVLAGQSEVRADFAELDVDSYAAAALCGDDRYKVSVPRSRLVRSARALLPSGHRAWEAVAG